MHVTHVQGIFSPEHGGPCRSLANYAQGQAARGHRVVVRVLEGYPHTSPALRLEAPIDFGVKQVQFPAKLGACSEFRKLLFSDDTPDLYHIHGAWLLCLYQASREAVRRGRPYMLEVMGMYDEFSLAQKPWRKRLFRVAFQDRVLREASCLHVNSPDEASQLRNLGFTNPIAVIPVGVEEGAGLDDAQSRSLEQDFGSSPFVLYLARIHSKKGIELLLQAWSEICKEFPAYRLVIAGAGEPGYVADCHNLANQLGINARCTWIGHTSEPAKHWLYRNAALYALPSFSENFGNTVPEALAEGCPVLTTTATPWRAVGEQGYGWITEPTLVDLKSALRQALTLPDSERRAMGENGRRWVQRHFSLSAVLDKQEATYSWLLGKSPCPAHVLITK